MEDLKKKYIVHIPSSTIEVYASDSDEAIEDALSEIACDCEAEDCEEIRKREELRQLPKPGMDDEYYISRFGNNHVVTGTKNKTTYISDGYRIYALGSEKYGAEKQADPRYMKTLQKWIQTDKYGARDESAPVHEIEITQELTEYIRATYSPSGDGRIYTFEANGIRHAVNAVWFLEAIYFTGAHCFTVKDDERSCIKMHTNGKAAMLLPVERLD